MTPTEKALREALTEILSVHANDNHRPKAFYIADAALRLPETVGEPVYKCVGVAFWPVGEDSPMMYYVEINDERHAKARSTLSNCRKVMLYALESEIPLQAMPAAPAAPEAK